MSREVLKGLIELVPEEEIDILCKIVLKFIPEVSPEEDELQALLEGRRDRAENGTISHEDIKWD